MSESKTEVPCLSLHDIANFGEEIEVSPGRKLLVKGISAKGCLALLIRFPDLRKWIAGNSLPMGDVLLQAPETLAAIIAAATGSPGDIDAEDIAATLPIEVQVNVVEAAYRQTFRSGFRPFVLRVLSMYEGVAASGNFGGDPATKSPQELKPSLDSDTTQKTSGTTPPDK